MTTDEVDALTEQDLLSYQRADGYTSRARVDQITTRFVRITWLTGPRCYDVLDRASAVWLNMVKR